MYTRTSTTYVGLAFCNPVLQIYAYDMLSMGRQTRSLLLLQLRIVSPNTIRVVASTITREVLLDIGSLFDGVKQLKYAIVLARLSHLLHCFGESKFGSINALHLVSPYTSITLELW